jgi:hypothetical protein
VRIAASRTDQNLADEWADQMTAMVESDPKNLLLVIADMARSNPPMSSTFVAELARRLQGQSSALALPLTWIEQRLAESGLTIEQSVQVEISNRPPTRCPSATVSVASGFWEPWTGASSWKR